MILFSKRQLLYLLSLLFTTTSFAAEYSVKGIVKDSVGNPESFATIRIYTLTDSVKPVVGSVAGEDGVFLLGLKEEGDYRLNIAAFGKTELNKEFSVSVQKPVADLGYLVLNTATEQLEEVVVTAQRPLISKEIDRIGYDVQADNEAKTSQLDQILKKVPLVSVDPDGTIKVKGDTNFKIYKNGRPNNSFSRNAKDIFKSIPASMIKKIEVITDPGSREDAEGTTAILNIVTMENVVVKGIMGNIGLRYSRYDDSPVPNVWLNSQIGKFNLSWYGGMGTASRRSSRNSSETLMRYDDSDNEQLNTSESTSKSKLFYTGVDMSLELDTLNLLTAEFGGYWHRSTGEDVGTTLMRRADGIPIYSYTSRSLWSPNSYADFNGGFNYQRSTRKKGENITLSYLISTTDQKQHSTSQYEDEVNLPVPYTGTANDFHLNFLEQTGQIDWTRPINDINKFDVGAKYIHRSNHSVNNLEYFNYETTHSDFKHTTQVLALYFDYRLKYKKLGARVGLRYEYSHLSAKYPDGSEQPFSSSLSDWVPNLSISYDINDANTFKLSYSTRINRPGISQLNPAVVETPTSISSGNPDLGSSRYQGLSLNYSFMSPKVNIDYNASYNFSNNTVIGVREVLPGDILRSGYDNSGRNRRFYMNVWAQFNITSKTSFMLNAGVDHFYEANRSLGIKESGWGFDGYCQVRQRLPYDFDISGSLSVYHSGPSLYQYRKFIFSSNSYYSIDLTKSLLKGKRLTLRASLMNPFAKSPRVFEFEPRNAGYTGYTRSYSYTSSNRFMFSVSYRFGSLNASVKKTAHSISNDDLQGRKN